MHVYFSLPRTKRSKQKPRSNSTLWCRRSFVDVEEGSSLFFHGDLNCGFRLQAAVLWDLLLSSVSSSLFTAVREAAVSGFFAGVS